MQYFFAQGWPMKIWFAIVMLLGAIVAGCTCQPTPALLRDWHFILLFVFAILVAPVFAFFLSLPITWIVVGPIYFGRARLNGAPFHVGDQVQVLVGPHRDKVTKIYSKWQGGTFRVELGPEAEKTYQDIFSEWQLLKIVIPNAMPEPTAP